MIKPPNHTPPKWSLKLLRWVIKDDYLEEIEGDMEEVFQEHLEQYSLAQSRRLYILGTFKLVRPSLIKPLIKTPSFYINSMFKNNLKIALRVFQRDRAYTLINVLGMAIGLAITMLIISYARFELSYEAHNPQADRLLRITLDFLDGNTVIEEDCETFPPIGPRMQEELPEIEAFTRAYHIDIQTIRVGEDYYRESGIYAADPAFFTLFEYPLIYGNPDKIFTQPHEAVLTVSQARKYFDRVDVVGETIWWSSIEKEFLITGVIEDSPPNTHLAVNMLISYPSMKASLGEVEDNWESNNTFTYVLLSENSDYAQFEAHLDGFTERLIEEEKIEHKQIVAQPIGDIHLYSNKTYEPEENGDATLVFILLGVAILVIVIAVVNHINLSTSKSLDRAREVGIRKVLGSSLSQLRVQFFTESFLINVFAGVLAIVLLMLFQEHFRQLAALPEALSFMGDPVFWFLLVGILLISTLFAGIFPAVILSSFKPVSILKGRFANTAKGSLLRKSLVVFQFFITIFLLTQTLTVGEQLRFMRGTDLGVNIEQTLVVRAPRMQQSAERNQTFRDQLLGQSQFESVTMSSCVPGLPTIEMSTMPGINLVEATEKHSFNFYLYWMDANFIPTMQMQLAAGDNFISESENPERVLVNEEAIRLWGISDAASAVGKKIELFDKQFEILGVVKNFHQASAKSPYIPMIFLPTSNFWQMASIRTQAGDTKAQLAMVKEIYQTNFPNSPFEYFFMDQEYDKHYRADEQFQQVFGALTGFAILIACFGLFGLVSFTVARRTKEIGIRKVLGAEVWQVIVLLSRDFLALIFLAMLFAIPLTYLALHTWLERYAFRIDLEAWLFLLPALAVLLVAFLTIFTKTFQLSTVNPIDSLRDE